MAPELFLAVALVAGLTLYALLGGADFGAGVWEFSTALQASPKERALLYRAIGPVWEANHVWLIFVLVGLFTAFPPAFAAICRALWVPLLLGLLGIVFRGAGYAFRAHAAKAVRGATGWGVVFALASTAAPFFLGAAAWAIASGRLAVTQEGGFTGNHLTGWLNPMSVFGAFFAVATCAYLAAVYLARDARREGDPDLVRTWRRRALGAGAWMGALSAAGLVVVATGAPLLWSGFRAHAAPLVVASAAGGLFSLWALWRWRFTGAAAGAAAAVAAVIWGWAIAQYPAIVPPTVLIESSRAPERVLRAAAAVVAAGAVLLVPLLGLLFHLFKGKHPEHRVGGP